MGEPRPADALLRALFDTAPFGIVVLDLDRKVCASNPALERLLGTLDGQRLEDLVHPADRPTVLQRFGELVEGPREQFQLETRWRKSDGTAFWGKLSCAKTPAGDEQWVSGLVEDISEVVATRVAREKVLFDLGERMKELTALHGTARLLDGSGELDALFGAVVKLLPPAFQFPAAATARLSLGPKSWESPGHRDTPVTLRATFETDARELGEVAVSYHDAPLAPGQAPFLPEETPLLESIAEMLQREVNRRSTTARALKERQRLDRVLNAAQMGVWELDAKANRVVWSEHFARMVGHQGPLVGPRGAFAQYFHPDDLVNIAQRIDALLASDAERLRLELRAARPGGGWRRLSAIGRLLRDDARAPARLLAVLSDVSDSRTLEDDVAHTQKVSAMATVSASVADDLEAVLVKMTSGVERLRLALPEGHADVALVRELELSGRHGAALIRRLRAFGSRGDFLPARVDLSELVDGAMPLLSRVSGGRIRLHCELEPGCVAWADRDQLEQVLLNLVVNARDATSAGAPVTLCTRTLRRDGAPPLAELSVVDCGCGMAPELLERIRTPFFTTKPEGQGTGLGLSVVFGVVKRCGGRVDVHSEVGHGTTFRIELPQAETAP